MGAALSRFDSRESSGHKNARLSHIFHSEAQKEPWADRTRSKEWGGAARGGMTAVPSGDFQSMRRSIVSRPSRRALFGAAALVAFALAGGSFLAKAQERASDQAEWPQSYEESPQMAVGR